MAFEEIELSETSDNELEKLATDIETYYKQDMADKLLRAYSWDEAIRFYDGDQHIEYNISTSNFQQVTLSKNNDFIPRPTTNYILSTVKTVVSQLTKQKPEVIVRPNSQDPRDIGAAKVGDLILDAKYEELREEEKQQEKAYWGIITGTVFKKVFWNNNTRRIFKTSRLDKEQQPILDESGNQSFDEIPLGDVDTTVVPPFNIALPLNTRSPLDLEWIMEYSVQKVDWIKEQYSKQEPGYTGLADEVSEEKDLSVVLMLEYRLRTLVGRRSGGSYATGSSGYIDIKKSAVLKEYYQRPSQKHPSGRMVIVASGKTLYSGDNPYYVEGIEDSWNPYVEWRFEIVPGRFWGKGLVDELVPIQRRLNAIDALIILNRKTMAISQWLVPNGSGIPNGYITGRPGLIINYNPVGANGAKPEKVIATPLPQQIIEERNQCIEEIKRLGMTYEVLEGQNPTGVKTAYQLEQLQENAIATFGAVFQRWEKSFEREQIKILLLVAKKYKEPRVDFNKKLKAVNKDISNIDVSMFIGEDLKDNVNVRVETGSSIPRSKAGENAVIRELVQNGLLNSQSAVNRRELMEKMGIKGFDSDSSPDIKRAQWENSIIENGNFEDLVVKPGDPQTDQMTGQPMLDTLGQPIMSSPETVLELDDDITHIIIHSVRVKDPNISPETRQKYLIHIEGHLQNQARGSLTQQQTGQPNVSVENKSAHQSQENANNISQGGV